MGALGAAYKLITAGTKLKLADIEDSAPIVVNEGDGDSSRGGLERGKVKNPVE